MPKVKDPITFSKAFDIQSSLLREKGILDPLLNVDTRLFIDPLLLEKSCHKEINKAKKQFNEHFETIIKLLKASKVEGDAAWKAAKKKLYLKEAPGICLGYGSSSISGKPVSEKLSKSILKTAKEIIDIGIQDPSLFFALSLLEEGIGPDTISDMTANAIYDNIANFTEAISRSLNLPVKLFQYNSREYNLPQNPWSKKDTPILLLPKDILRNLPIVNDWDEIADAAAHNELLRDRVNREIGNIWSVKTKNDKRRLRENVLSSKKAFQTLLDAIDSIPKTHYDYELDSQGLVTWLKYVREPSIDSLDLSTWSHKVSLSCSDVKEIVKKIIQQFQVLIEQKGLWKELWAGSKNRPEKNVQRLFFAIADSFCKANRLDLSPEADSGAGPVDFKISTGDKKILVELKLSNNPNLIHGYQVQIEAYKKAEEVDYAFYIVIDVGKLSKNKREALHESRKEAISIGSPLSELVFINGQKQLSASKRKN